MRVRVSGLSWDARGDDAIGSRRLWGEKTFSPLLWYDDDKITKMRSCSLGTRLPRNNRRDVLCTILLRVPHPSPVRPPSVLNTLFDHELVTIDCQGDRRLTCRRSGSVNFTTDVRTDNGSVNELGECAQRFTRVPSTGLLAPLPSQLFPTTSFEGMAGIRYVSRLSSSLRPATTKTTGLRSRYVPARALATANASPFAALDTFADRHIGPDASETVYMLKQLGYNSMDAFIAATVPAHIRVPEDDITNATIPSLSESELIQRAKALGRENKMYKNYIGMGYHNSVVPPVILRNVSSGVSGSICEGNSTRDRF